MSLLLAFNAVTHSSVPRSNRLKKQPVTFPFLCFPSCEIFTLNHNVIAYQEELIKGLHNMVLFEYQNKDFWHCCQNEVTWKENFSIQIPVYFYIINAWSRSFCRMVSPIDFLVVIMKWQWCLYWECSVLGVLTGTFLWRMMLVDIFLCKVLKESWYWWLLYLF